MDLDAYDLDPRPSPWKRRSARLAAVAAVVTMIALAFWPPTDNGLRGDSEEARACGSKLGTMAMAIATNHSAERTLSESEINAHLRRLIEQNQDAQKSRGLTLGLTGLSVDLGSESSALFVNGRFLVVPLVFEARYVTGEPPNPLRLRSLRLGHLPLIGPFKALVASQMKALLAALPTESTVLTRADGIEMHHDRATISVAGPASGDMILPPD